MRNDSFILILKENKPLNNMYFTPKKSCKNKINRSTFAVYLWVEIWLFEISTQNINKCHVVIERGQKSRLPEHFGDNK